MRRSSIGLLCVVGVLGWWQPDAGSGAAPAPVSSGGPVPSREPYSRRVTPSRPSAAPKPSVLPTLNAAGAPTRSVESEGFKLDINLAPQIIELRAEEPSVGRYDLNIAVGDTIELVTDDVVLRLGETAVATLSKGQRLYVSEVEKDWLATSALVDDEVKSGWLPAAAAKRVAVDSVLGAVPGTFGGGRLVPTGVLIQKAKQFDDGLYAAVELAAQHGAGAFPGKDELLRTLATALASGAPTKAAVVVGAAAQLGGQKLALPGELQAAVEAEVGEFNVDELRSKPLGFYTWSGDLSAIFKQDRMLQTELDPNGGLGDVVAALRNAAAARQIYERYLGLTARLTNPWEYEDLRAAIGGAAVDPKKSYRVFPPSVSYESTLVMRLYGNRPIPPGFDLMNELIAQVRAGKVDLKPRDDSGWYDRQTYSFETLIRPEKAAEARRVRYNEEYQKLLTDLFKGALALTRETHVKQLDIPAPGAVAPFGPPVVRKKIFLNMELSVEPTATHYQRRAETYRYIQAVLRDTFGPEALAKLHRQTADGPVQTDLEQELQDVTALFDGAALTAARQLGMTDVGLPPGGVSEGEAAATAFLKWSTELADDADLGRDARMMVPVFFDLERQKTKVWVFLGWQARSVQASFVNEPSVGVRDAAGKVVAPDDPQFPEIHWYGGSHVVVAPVMAEVYVGRLLNRDEFRRHCDAYRTRSAILANLR